VGGLVSACSRKAIAAEGYAAAIEGSTLAEVAEGLRVFVIDFGY
jgi:hypothetical protein